MEIGSSKLRCHHALQLIIVGQFCRGALLIRTLVVLCILRAIGGRRAEQKKAFSTPFESRDNMFSRDDRGFLGFAIWAGVSSMNAAMREAPQKVADLGA
jgi:hypothetical protein